MPRAVTRFSLVGAGPVHIPKMASFLPAGPGHAGRIGIWRVPLHAAR